MHYENEVDSDKKLRIYLKIKDVINNMFRPQKTLKRRRTKLYHTLAFPTLLHGTENQTIKTRDERGITAAEMKYLRKTAGYTGTDCKTNREFAKGLNITPGLDKMQEYRRNQLQHISSMPRIRLPKTIKKIQTKGQKKPGKNIKETSGCVRPERDHKWRNCILASRW